MSPDPRTPVPAQAAGAAAPPQPDAPDVIHNIGYRHYEGPRLGRAYARRSLFVQTLRGAYGLGRSAKSKILPMLLFAVMSAPALIFVALAVFTHAHHFATGYGDYVISMLPLTGLYIAAMAPQAVSLDLRFRVVPLYFSRPIGRADYVTAKYAAFTAALLVFTGTPMLIMYVGALLAKLDFADQTEHFALGLVCALLFSLLHAGIGLYISALTPRRGFGVAAVIAVQTIPYALVNVLIRIMEIQQGGTARAGWLGLLSPGTLIDGVQRKLLGGQSLASIGVHLSGAQVGAYVLVIAALVAGTYLLMLRRYRKAGL